MSEQSLTEDVAGTTSPDNEGQAEHSSAATASPDVAEHSRATTLGWQDKDAYLARGGREDAWVPYDEFLRIHDRTMPLLRKENKKLERQLDAARTEQVALRAEVAEIRKFQQAQQTAGSEIEVSSLWSLRGRAMEAGDHQEVNKIDRQIREAEKRAAPPPEQPKSNGVDPQAQAILTEFADEHPEYKENTDMQGALQMGAEMALKGNPSLRNRALLDKAHELASKAFPGLYAPPAPRPRAKPMAEMGGEPNRSTNGVKSWSDLKTDVAGPLETWIKQTYPAGEVAKAKERILKNATPDQFRSR